MDWKIVVAVVVGVAIGLGAVLYLNGPSNAQVDDSIPVRIGGTFQTEDGQSKSLQVEFDLSKLFKAFQTPESEWKVRAQNAETELAEVKAQAHK